MDIAATHIPGGCEVVHIAEGCEAVHIAKGCEGTLVVVFITRALRTSLPCILSFPGDGS